MGRTQAKAGLLVVPVLICAAAFQDERVEKVKQLVAVVRGELAGQDSLGGGILIGMQTDRLYIATANHVVRRGSAEVSDLRVEFRKIPGEAYAAKLLGRYDTQLDLAVIAVLGIKEIERVLEELSPGLVANSATLTRGDAVYPLGHPDGKLWFIRPASDTLSRKDLAFLYFDTQYLSPGHSGGALLNSRYQLVGLLVSDQRPEGKAIRMDMLRERLESWGYPTEFIDILEGEVPPNGKVNINTASLEDLDTLPGIGPALAQRIIDFRNAHGRFQKIEDIMKVPLIKHKRFEAIKNYITVGNVPEKRPEPPRSASSRKGDENPAPINITNTTIGGVAFGFVEIPPGTFCMGSNVKKKEQPVHCVKITDGFQIGIHEVTQAQWFAVMGKNPSRFKGRLNHPVENVSWYKVKDFLGRMNDFRDGHRYRLPTEAEWEYASRAGSGETDSLEEVGWCGKKDDATHEVGQLAANGWGLHDVYGNVWEWIEDCHHNFGYEDRRHASCMNEPCDSAAGNVVVNPKAREPEGLAGCYRARRGGSWKSKDDCRIARRGKARPGDEKDDIGFRLVRQRIN